MKTTTLLHGAALLALIGSVAPGSVQASTLVQQTPLPGACIPQFAVSLPVFGPAGPIKRVNAEYHPALTVTMKEINQAVLPQGAFDLCGMGVQFGPTRVWAYETSDTFTGKVLGPANWPAVTVEAQRWEPTLMKYVNKLPSFNPANPFGPGLVQGLVSVDQTIDWADPLGTMMSCMNNPAAPGCGMPYTGPAPAAVHLHGGEVSSLFDGGPEAWMTPDGKTGPGFFSLWNAGPGAAVYAYPNRQEAGTLWFHDHAMGATRTNVYSGMAAFYFLRDPYKEPANLPQGPYEVEMAIQDRQFDTNSQLFFPDGSGVGCGTGLPGDPCLNGAPGNPTIHPLWIPEFIGDVVVVNGAPWPYFNVQPRRYRFRLLDGSNARFYNLDFGAAKVYAIGTDGNYLNTPKALSKVFMAPGERYDVIVDFTGLNGQSITVTNDAPMPYPEGLSPVPYANALCAGGICPADQPTMANVMQFHVGTTSVSDTSCNPAVAGQCVRPSPGVALTDGAGHLAAGVKIDKRRQLVLKEHEDPTTGTPVEVFVNNTRFHGKGSAGITVDFPTDGISELPQQGSTELWEIVNLTTDAHPMHLHLTQFQIVNREHFDDGPDKVSGYLTAWASAFGTAGAPLPAGCTAGTFCPGYGPPLPYGTPNADGALGGNPAVGPYLLGDVTPPNPEESGWKDTAKVMPHQVLRLIVRYVPSSKPLVASTTYAGQNLYPFDPTLGDGYVWHCHIIDHEDNEMMRPFRVVK